MRHWRTFFSDVLCQYRIVICIQPASQREDAVSPMLELLVVDGTPRMRLHKYDQVVDTHGFAGNRCRVAAWKFRRSADNSWHFGSRHDNVAECEADLVTRDNMYPGARASKLEAPCVEPTKARNYDPRILPEATNNTYCFVEFAQLQYS